VVSEFCWTSITVRPPPIAWIVSEAQYMKSPALTGFQ